jgi:DNA-directed RNA polymerase subunit RPC12/RpoP
MGAKAPSKLKLRRPTYKCGECSRKFLSTQALKSHQYCVHKIKGTQKPIKGKAKLTTLLGKAVKKEDTSPVQSVTKAKNNVSKKNTPSVDGEEQIPNTEVRKIQFECPQCLKIFNVYFSAFRHIQKSHCINEAGKKV